MTQPEMFPGAVLRPSLNDTSVRMSAIDALIADIGEWWGTTMSEESEADAREILADSLHSHNGFELAKDFDRNGWSVDAELVNVLDGAFSALSAAHQRAVHAWVEATSPLPKLSIGASVVTPDEPPVAGEIVRIDDRDATYLVCVPSLGHVREGMGTLGYIYAWERLEAANP